MIASAFTTYAPVLVRYESVYGLPIPPPVIVFCPVLLLGVYDFLLDRRLHRATMWTAFLLIVVLLPLYLVLSNSRLADMLIDALR